MLFHLPLLSLAPGSFAQCEGECDPLASILSRCALPPFTATHNRTFPPASDYRNLTGLEFYTSPRLLPGPFTSFLEPATDAECLCTDGVHWLHSGSHCLSSYRFVNSQPILQDDERTMDRYRSDCGAWGYFANETLGYPTTTRSAMPASQTGDLGLGSGESTCGAVCSVIRGQIDDCGLTPLDTNEEDMPRVVRVDFGYSASLLLNRTAGECLCSVPVLRRLRGCRMCIGAEKDPGVPTIIRIYLEECQTLQPGP
ncbi:hypothetical protein BJX62DRAFT_231021 [Aspergillus germanicus]